MCGKHCEATRNQRHRTSRIPAATVHTVSVANTQSLRYTDSKVREVKRSLSHDLAERARDEIRASHVRYVERCLFILLGLAIEIVLDQFFVLPVILAKVIIILPDVARETVELIKRL